MKYLLIVVVAVCLSAVSARASLRAEEWETFKANFGKDYSSLEEELDRQRLFLRRSDEIKRHNAQPNKTFVMGVNQFTDVPHMHYGQLVENRFRNMMSSRRSVAGERQSDRKFSLDQLLADNTPIPESVDWSTFPNRVGPVRNQGNCGACWAFSTTGLLEGQLFKSANQTVTLSVQNLLDCDTDGYTYGCVGGTVLDALESIKKLGGIESEEKYPYVSGSGKDDFKCLYKPEKAIPFDITETEALPTADEQTLQKVVATYGPVAVRVDSHLPSFRSYKSGVYYDKSCDPTNLDHGVLVVGYGEDKEHGKYWKIKNSWSNLWGEEGYVRLARDRDNHCGVASQGVIFNYKST